MFQYLISSNPQTRPLILVQKIHKFSCWCPLHKNHANSLTAWNLEYTRVSKMFLRGLAFSMNLFFVPFIYSCTKNVYVWLKCVWQIISEFCGYCKPQIVDRKWNYAIKIPWKSQHISFIDIKGFIEKKCFRSVQVLGM